MLPEPGHLNPTFPVARALADRGHEVIYTSVLDLRPAIEARGFACVPIHKDIVRLGRLAEIDQLATREERDAAWGQIRDRINDEYFDGTIQDAIRQIDPAVIAADVILLSPIQFVAHRLGIPWLQISTSLSQHHDELPPISSALLPGARPLELEASRWETSCLRFLAFDTVPLANIIASNLDIYGARFGYPSEHVSLESVFNPVLTLAPEIVLCAPALDFPRRSTHRPRYFTSPVETDRPEHVPATLEAFAARHPTLVYASLGSQSARYPDAIRFFRSVVEVMRTHPAWAAVITGPRFIDHPVFADLPDNVLVLPSAPQLWVLRRAAVFLTHAGLGGVREAIALQVPMIAVPQMFDQPGNAARVAYHDLGVQLPPDAITSASLATALDHVLDHHATYRARLARLHEASLQEEAAHDSIDLFEQTAAAGTRPARGSGGSDCRLAPVALAPVVERSVRGWLFVGRSGYKVLRPGTVLHDDRTEHPIGIGLGGWTIYRDLTTALLRASGSLLAHVEAMGELTSDGALIAGRSLRCHWVLDVNEALYDYAAWCADQVLEPERAIDPATVTALLDLIQRFHALRRGGARPRVLVTAFREAYRCAMPLWHRGHGNAAAAIASNSHDAARWSHRLATQRMARRSVGAAAGTRAGADRFEHELASLSARFSAELERRIHTCMRTSRIREVRASP